MDFDQAVNELVNQAGVPYGYIFDFRAADKASIFERFYDFCQTNLTGHTTEADIQPAMFYFNPNQGINARAYQQNGYFLIEFYLGLFIKLYNHLYNYNEGFDTDQVLYEKYMPLVLEDVTPGVIMYQVATQFAFYHERAHLIQRSSKLSQGIDEEYVQGPNVAYDFDQHLREFDADMDGAQIICWHMIEYWKKYPAEQQTLGTISSLLALAASAIFTFFVYLEGRDTPVYYDEKSHPHPLIRITYVIDFFMGVAERNLPNMELDARAVLREAFDITERVAIANNRPNPVERYAAVFVAEHDRITNYIQVLIDESNKVPNLVKNRFK
nr:hypothetical protein [uncultured Mucilaginibacter sp.]